MLPLLNTREAADVLGVAPGTLEDWRARGTGQGPKWLKVGHAVRYRLQELEEWIEARVVLGSEGRGNSRIDLDEWIESRIVRGGTRKK